MEGNKCKCSAGFTGSRCGIPLSGDCKGGCGTHGTCIVKNKCITDSGCTGKNCQAICKAESICKCKDGFKGKKCEIAPIPVCQPSCGINGVCTAQNHCTCSKGWTGPDCRTPPACNPPCSHGKCEHGKCTCEKGWYGGKCEIPLCSRRCINGVCIGHNQCKCQTGWTGETCGIPMNAQCDGKCEHGTCVTEDQCTPKKDCTGDNCKAICVVVNKCKCEPGWKGKYCSEPAPGICIPQCSSAGQCSSDNKCICSGGWSGPTCATPPVPRCEPACSSNGRCVAKNTCLCNSGWRGPLCNEKRKTIECSDAVSCAKLMKVKLNVTVSVEKFKDGHYSKPMVNIATNTECKDPETGKMGPFCKPTILKEFHVQLLEPPSNQTVSRPPPVPASPPKPASPSTNTTSNSTQTTTSTNNSTQQETTNTKNNQQTTTNNNNLQTTTNNNNQQLQQTTTNNNDQQQQQTTTNNNNQQQTKNTIPTRNATNSQAKVKDETQNLPNKDGTMSSSWSSWSPCINGKQTRTRIISGSTNSKSNNNNNDDDEKEDFEKHTRKCSHRPDCQVSRWSNWSECAPEGLSYRHRKIISHAGKGGKPCPKPADLKQSRFCKPNTPVNPIDCKVGKWSKWSKCNTKHHQQCRQRQVIHHPTANGLPCPKLHVCRPCFSDDDSIKFDVADSYDFYSYKNDETDTVKSQSQNIPHTSESTPVPTSVPQHINKPTANQTPEQTTLVRNEAPQNAEKIEKSQTWEQYAGSDPSVASKNTVQQTSSSPTQVVQNQPPSASVEYPSLQSYGGAAAKEFAPQSTSNTQSVNNNKKATISQQNTKGVVRLEADVSGAVDNIYNMMSGLVKRQGDKLKSALRSNSVKGNQLTTSMTPSDESNESMNKTNDNTTIPTSAPTSTPIPTPIPTPPVNNEILPVSSAQHYFRLHSDNSCSKDVIKVGNITNQCATLEGGGSIWVKCDSHVDWQAVMYNDNNCRLSPIAMQLGHTKQCSHIGNGNYYITVDCANMGPVRTLEPKKNSTVWISPCCSEENECTSKQESCHDETPNIIDPNPCNINPCEATCTSQEYRQQCNSKSNDSSLSTKQVQATKIVNKQASSCPVANQCCYVESEVGGKPNVLFQGKTHLASIVYNNNMPKCSSNGVPKTDVKHSTNTDTTHQHHSKSVANSSPNNKLHQSASKLSITPSYDERAIILGKHTSDKVVKIKKSKPKKSSSAKKKVKKSPSNKKTRSRNNKRKKIKTSVKKLKSKLSKKTKLKRKRKKSMKKQQKAACIGKSCKKNSLRKLKHQIEVTQEKMSETQKRKHAKRSVKKLKTKLAKRSKRSSKKKKKKKKSKQKCPTKGRCCKSGNFVYHRGTKWVKAVETYNYPTCMHSAWS